MAYPSVHIVKVSDDESIVDLKLNDMEAFAEVKNGMVSRVSLRHTFLTLTKAVECQVRQVVQEWLETDGVVDGVGEDPNNPSIPAIYDQDEG